MKFSEIKEKIIHYFQKDDFLLMLSSILISFLNAWDFRDRVLSQPIVNTDNDWSALELTRPILTLLHNILSDNYWAFFMFHILFMLSFYYVGKKFGLKSIWIFVLTLTLPVIRYGVWDYGTKRGDSFVYIIMIWTYYYGKQNRNWKYYTLSIIGALTREFCLYVNIFFIIDDFVKEINFENLNVFFKEIIPRFKSTFKHYIFEISMIIIYYVARTIYFNIVGFNSSSAGMINTGNLQLLFTHYKLWIDFLFIYGILWVVLLMKPRVNIYLFLVVIFIPSFLFGIIWEINKMGCVFMIIAYELLRLDNQKPKKQPIQNTEVTPTN